MLQEKKVGIIVTQIGSWQIRKGSTSSSSSDAANVALLQQQTAARTTLS